MKDTSPDSLDSSESPFHQNNLIHQIYHNHQNQQIQQNYQIRQNHQLSEKAKFVQFAALFCEDSNQSDTQIVEYIHPSD